MPGVSVTVSKPRLPPAVGPFVPASKSAGLARPPRTAGVAPRRRAFRSRVEVRRARERDRGRLRGARQEHEDCDHERETHPKLHFWFASFSIRYTRYAPIASPTNMPTEIAHATGEPPN